VPTTPLEVPGVQGLFSFAWLAHARRQLQFARAALQEVMPLHQVLTALLDASSALQVCTRHPQASRPLLVVQAVWQGPTGLVLGPPLPRPAPCAMLVGIRLARLSRPLPGARFAWQATTRQRPGCRRLFFVKPALQGPTGQGPVSPAPLRAPSVRQAPTRHRSRSNPPWGASSAGRGPTRPPWGPRPPRPACSALLESTRRPWASRHRPLA
jgi:hypothetical protein